MERDRGRHAELIIEARKDLGLSQRELARRLDVTAGMIGQLELGETLLGEDTTRRLGEVLELDTAQVHALMATREERAGQLARKGTGRPVRPAPELLAEISRLDDVVDDLRRRLAIVELRLGMDDDLPAAAASGRPRARGRSTQRPINDPEPDPT